MEERETCCEGTVEAPAPSDGAAVYWYVLDTFAAKGRAPLLDDIARDLLKPRQSVVATLESLAGRGDIRIDAAATTILDAYPYSGVPTRYRLDLEDGPQCHVMCAVDAFYVPFLTGRAARLSAHCFLCRSVVELDLAPDGLRRAEPAGAVIWNSTLAYDCPKTNIFCSDEHLARWRDEHLDEPGSRYDLTAAAAAGKRAADRMLESRQALNPVLWAPFDALVCYCRTVAKATVVAAIADGAATVDAVRRSTTACTGKWCSEVSPRRRCCRPEIEALLKAYEHQGG